MERLEAGGGAEELAVLQSVDCGRTEGHKQSGVWRAVLETPPHQHGAAAAVLEPERFGGVHAAHETAL